MNLQEGLKTWEQILSKCINDLQGRYPRLKDAQIADRLDIPRATYNRIKNEQKLPRLDNLIKVVIGSGNTTILSEAIALLDKGLGNSLKSALSVALKEDQKNLADDELETLLDNRDVFIAYLLTGLPNGTDKSQLVEVLGSSGLGAIKTLLNKNIATEKDSRYFMKSDGIIIRSFDSIKHHLSTYSRFYKTEHVGKEINYAHSLSGGLNREGVKRSQEAHRRFHEEMQSIYRDKSNEGEIPSFTVSFCDTFTSFKKENHRPSQKEGLQ